MRVPMRPHPMGQPSELCPLHEPVQVLTHNANGVLTKIRVRHRKVSRLSNIASYVRTGGIDILGIQEIHVLNDDHLVTITN